MSEWSRVDGQAGGLGGEQAGEGVHCDFEVIACVSECVSELTGGRMGEGCCAWLGCGRRKAWNWAWSVAEENEPPNEIVDSVRVE